VPAAVRMQPDPVTAQGCMANWTDSLVRMRDCTTMLRLQCCEAGSRLEKPSTIDWTHKRTGLVCGETMHRHMSTWSRSAVYTNTAGPFWPPTALPGRTGGQQTCGGCGTRHRRVGCCSV
jgi:hypothetical protein